MPNTLEKAKLRALPSPKPGSLGATLGGKYDNDSRYLVAEESEGVLDFADISEGWLFQSRTKFDVEHQAWVTYPVQYQEQLQDAYRRDQASKVTVTFKDEDFEVDLKAMTQTNTRQSGKVRDVRRVQAGRRAFWCTRVGDTDSDPVPFTDAESKIIEEGTGKDRAMMHDAVCYTLRLKNGSVVYVDLQRMRQYASKEDPRFRRIFSLPSSIAPHMSSGNMIKGLLPKSSPTFKRVKASFNACTEDGYDLEDVECLINPKLYLQWMDKITQFGDGARICIVYHGTLPGNIDAIAEHNFSLNKIGDRTNNRGYFGKGIYFARHARTAIAYNQGNRLLICLAVVKKVFHVPLPDSAKNPYHGKDCERGYDSHISPLKKELVMFNPRQILPCFVGRLGKACTAGEDLTYE